MNNGFDKKLLARGVRMNTIVLAVVLGLGCGLGLFFFTHLTLAVFGPRAGYYLHLLSVFFPGYEVSAAGAWIGLFWGFVFAALSGALMYQVYIRSTGHDVTEDVTPDPDKEHLLAPPIIKLSGHALGLAFGVIFAAQLILTTTWLVVRGTADQSYHAMLMSNYLPGYSVSILGALIGAVSLFAYAYAMSRLLAYVYNLIVSKRNKKG